ncbi:hypothetical protein ASG35_11815 [Burkholderia sp. Leaf177]|nr:hypothetical protein ASG35_11815 [Burkholderia sp. Leaf177]
MIFGKPNSNDERIVFLMAGSREAASKRATSVLAALFDIEPLEVSLYNLASFVDLVDSGVSDDEDLRIFELGWKGPIVSVWAEHPLFLIDDSSLLGKCAELYADLASATAVEAIRRARS